MNKNYIYEFVKSELNFIPEKQYPRNHKKDQIL